MEVCKNNSSGHYFIYIQEIGTEEARLVTPKAQIKVLKLDLFADLEDYSEEDLLEREIITSEQIQKLHEYNKNRLADSKENMNYYFSQLAPHEQKLFIKKLVSIYEKNKSKI